MAGDLHTHTTASDGLLVPEELVRLAVNKGLKVLGITDHDTVGGLAEALDAGYRQGMTIIPGVELSTEWDERELHILGYHIDWQNEELLVFLEMMRRARQQRNAKIIVRLKELGYDISMSEVEKISSGGAIGRSHIASVLVQKGFTPSIEAAFNTLLKRGQVAYIPRAKVTPDRAIKLILAAQGVPILAHPGLSRSDSLIPSMVNSGLQGIEAYYPQHDEFTTKYYLELAANYNLVITGGSDFHGYQGDDHADLGTCRVSIGAIRKLLRRAKSLGKSK